MVEFTQIGWFHPGSRRFAYTDVIDDMVRRGRGIDGHTIPVYAIDPGTASRLSVQLESPATDRQRRYDKIADNLSCLLDKWGDYSESGRQSIIATCCQQLRQ